MHIQALEDISKGRIVEEVMGEVMLISDCAARLQTPKRRAAASTTASHFLISIGESVSVCVRACVCVTVDTEATRGGEHYGLAFLDIDR